MPKHFDRALIVGAGDVVAKRLLPALEASRFASHYDVFHDGVSDLSLAQAARVTVIDMSRRPEALRDVLSDKLCGAPAPIFLATPPKARVELTKAALEGWGPVICEKPLFIDRASQSAFLGIQNDFDRLFALSYYVQEKAIAWTWLNRAIPGWEPLLAEPIAGGLAAARDLFVSLGPLEEVRIDICEGKAHSAHPKRRFWFEDVANGVWFDMGVHAFMMLWQICAASTHPSQQVHVDHIRNDSNTRFEVNGEVGRARFQARFGKHFESPHISRQLQARYAAGYCNCNFETGTAEIVSDKRGAMRLVPRYGDQKYATLVRHVLAFCEKGTLRGGLRVDNLYDQLATLDLMLQFTEQKPFA